MDAANSAAQQAAMQSRKATTAIATSATRIK
jgi:hypothetical protein